MAWLARCSPAMLTSPRSQAAPSARNAGSSQSAMTVSVLGKRLSPYAAWTAFATVLNSEVARRNP